jgi:hypothetical protein
MLADEPEGTPSGRSGGPGADRREFTSELKFVVDGALAHRIRDWARERLDADPHGGGAWSDEYRVSSVYLDTEARDVFHRRGSYGRSKYRIRRYEQNPMVFLERKLRTGTRLAKRRTTIDLGLLPLIGGSTLNGDATAWFRRRVALRGLVPVCQVSYTRIARIGRMNSGPVRLTLDDRLAACANQSFAFDAGHGTPLLDGSAIVEMKYLGTIPIIFKEAVETFALTPRRWSKYRAAAAALGLVDTTRDDLRSAHG